MTRASHFEIFPPCPMATHCRHFHACPMASPLLPLPHEKGNRVGGGATSFVKGSHRMHATLELSRRRLTIIPFAFLEVGPFSAFYGGGSPETISWRSPPFLWGHPFKRSSVRWASWVFNFLDLCVQFSGWSGVDSGWKEKVVVAGPCFILRSPSHPKWPYNLLMRVVEKVFLLS